MKRGYITALAIAAGGILVAGALIRPKPAAKTQAPPVQAAPAPPPPSRRGQMRQISDFLSERGNDVSRHVVYVPSAKGSGVVWPDGNVVTVAPPPAIVTTVPPREQTDPVSLAPASRYSQSGWIVVSARSSDGQPIAASGILGGVANATCGEVAVRKLVFNVPLDASLAGASVFDLSGDLLGIVIHCGETWLAVTPEGVQDLLGRQQGADAVAWHDFGVRTRTPDDEERRLLHIREKGLFVAETRKGSRAFNIGLRPGDLLLRSGKEPIQRTEDLLALGDQITAVREGRTLALSVTPAYTLQIPSVGAVLTSVQPNTKLYAAGLREGDRIIRVGGVEDPGPTDLNRLLAQKKPSWLVYEREDRRVWVMLR